MTTVAVTGSAGFIGSHLCDHLLAGGHRVVGVDNMATGRRENLAAAEEDGAFTFVGVDIRDDALLEPFELHRPEVVMHLAAQSGVRPSLEDPDPWNGLTEFVWYATERQATDRIASEAATGELRGEAARCGGRLFDTLVALVVRAQEQGSVRGDIAAPDIVMMLKRTSMSLRGWEELGFDWRGYVTVVLDGLRTESVRG